ncbi:hypothetical protein CcrKarma_gp248 [Caulobacter virus Karma]|uniref:hypothetical protein n=1 Tax=Caulobacter virus Karma TaxID=1211641 RepID=UPI00028AD593|nr:hypothetical protein CcrKarma_gp248 [Caulobacter virus Karma]AFU87765.1 hypothetical protein CcrKarma_gp248 [Caulobacter virus Karma]
MNDEIKRTHEAYGTIGYSHTQGDTDLVGVDYAQGHYVTLTIKTAVAYEGETHDRFHGDKYICKVAMSEVQWAAFIANPNRGDGVPCTLQFYRDPLTGETKHPKYHREQMTRVERTREAVTARAKALSTKVKEAQAELQRLMDGGPIKKGDLKTLKDLLYFANQDMESNLGYFVERVEETIDKAVVDAKAQVDAHVDFVVRELGVRALGARLQEAIDAGHDPGAVGQALIGLVAPPEADPT